MKKSLAFITLAAMTLSIGSVSAQSRRDRDSRRGGQCMEQIKRLRNELISAQSENTRISSALSTCQSRRGNGNGRVLREELSDVNLI